jgi:hypothetical protein
VKADDPAPMPTAVVIGIRPGLIRGPVQESGEHEAGEATSGETEKQTGKAGHSNYQNVINVTYT